MRQMSQAADPQKERMANVPNSAASGNHESPIFIGDSPNGECLDVPPPGPLLVSHEITMLTIYAAEQTKLNKSITILPIDILSAERASPDTTNRGRNTLRYPPW